MDIYQAVIDELRQRNFNTLQGRDACLTYRRAF